MKKLAVVLAGTMLCLMTFVSFPTRSQERNKLHRNSNKIANHYIVVLNDSVVGEKGAYSISPYVADDLASRHGGKVQRVYQHAINGFAVEMSEAAAEAMAKDFRVAFVEEDGVMSANTTQNNPPWGLDRIDQRNRPLSGTMSDRCAGVW